MMVSVVVHGNWIQTVAGHTQPVPGHPRASPCTISPRRTLGNHGRRPTAAGRGRWRQGRTEWLGAKQAQKAAFRRQIYLSLLRTTPPGPKRNRRTSHWVAYSIGRRSDFRPGPKLKKWVRIFDRRFRPFWARPPTKKKTARPGTDKKATLGRTKKFGRGKSPRLPMVLTSQPPIGKRLPVQNRWETGASACCFDSTQAHAYHPSAPTYDATHPLTRTNHNTHAAHKPPASTCRSHATRPIPTPG